MAERDSSTVDITIDITSMNTMETEKGRRMDGSPKGQLG
jgi:hypothetical protein